MGSRAVGGIDPRTAGGVIATTCCSEWLSSPVARGEMPYGQFVQEDTLIGIRTAAAIRPFTQEAE